MESSDKKLTHKELEARHDELSTEFELYRRTMENRLMLQRELTERQIQTKSAMVAKITHSIKIPMNGVLSMIDVLKQTSLNNEQSEYLHIIQTYTTQLLGMINDLTDLTKIESGDVQIINRTSNLVTEVEEVIKGLQLRAHGKGIELSVRHQPDLPEAMTCDSHRIKQVLSNLLNNCIQATTTGSVSVDMQVGRESRSTTMVSFQLEDTSPGLTDAQNTMLSQALVTGDYMSLLKLEVWGISMAISYQLIKLMHGEFGYETKAGQGSRFWFKVPVGLNQTFINPNPNQPMTINKAKRALRILLVEDNLLNQKFAVATLVREGHTVDIAENGKVAIDKFQSTGYDLILMDIQMPIMDGIQATVKIREIEQERHNSHMKIVAVTAYALEKDKSRCLAAGMDDFLAKPFKPQELIGLIEGLEL